MKVGKEIALEAKKKGICEEWFADMIKKNDIKPLCEMYFKGDDWAMEKDFPDLSILRKFKGSIFPYGMIVDSISEKFENNYRIAFFGTCDSEITYNNYSVGKVIVRHQSKVKISAFGSSKVFINLLDEAEIEVEAIEDTEVIIYQYSTSSKFKISGNVEVKESKF